MDTWGLFTDLKTRIVNRIFNEKDCREGLLNDFHFSGGPVFIARMTWDGKELKNVLLIWILQKSLSCKKECILLAHLYLFVNESSIDKS